MKRTIFMNLKTGEEIASKQDKINSTSSMQVIATQLFARYVYQDIQYYDAFIYVEDLSQMKVS